MKLRIVTASEAVALLKSGWPTLAVSLVGDDLRFPLESFGPHHVVLRFHDIEKEISGYAAPTRQQMVDVLKHASGITDIDRVPVHCHAGKSRSPAMAIGILIQSGLSPAQAFDVVQGARPKLIPNLLMIRLLDEILRLNGELISLVRRHYELLGPEAKLPDRGGLNL